MFRAMRTPTRHLRACVAGIPGIRTPLSLPDLERREALLGAARTVLVEFGRDTFSIPQFAQAIDCSAHTLRRFFIDLEALLAEILNKHLQGISDAMSQFPRACADWPAARRAAYLAFTRKAFGTLTTDHFIFTRDYLTLPTEERRVIEDFHDTLGSMLGGISARDTLSLLDDPAIDADEIEILIARRVARHHERLEALAAIRPPAAAPARLPEPEPVPNPVPELVPELVPEPALVSNPVREPGSVPKPVPQVAKPAPFCGTAEDPWPPSVYERHMAAMQARAGPCK